MSHSGFQGIVDKLRPSSGDASSKKSATPSSRITSSTGDRSSNAQASINASSRISASDPARQAQNAALDAERAKVKALERIVEQQKKTIEALSDRIDKQGVENGNNFIATRAMYRELEAQTRWLEELDQKSGEQAASGKEILKKFRHYKSD